MTDKRFRDLEAIFDLNRSEKRHTRDDEEREKRPPDRYATAQVQKAQAAALAGLFEDGAAKKLARAVETSTDRVSLQAALDEYLEKYGAFPPNPDFLERALDTRKDRMLRDIVQAIEEALPGADRNRRRVLLRKMSVKARTTFDGIAAKHMKRLVEQYDADM